MSASAKSSKTLSFKWNEGRFAEVKELFPFIPEHQRYIEPFIGNGQIFLEYNPKGPVLLNDTDKGLIHFYQHIGNKKFEKELKWIGQAWDLLDKYYNIIKNEIIMVVEDFYAGIISKPDLIYVVRVIVLMNTNNPAFSKLFHEKQIIDFDRFTSLLINNILEKLARIKQNSIKGKKTSVDEIDELMLTTVKSSFYNHFLFILNHSKQFKILPEKQASLWFFTREMSHGNEFRPGNNNEYTASYGGVTYNHRHLTEKTNLLCSPRIVELFIHARFTCLDFEEFLAGVEPGHSDFIMINLPLRNALNNPSNVQFEGKTYRRLASVLELLPSKWMLVVRKNEENTPLFKIPNASVTPVLNDKKPGKGADYFIIKNY